METIELAAQDRERIDRLIGLIKPVPDVIVSCTEAARLLGVNRNTITNMLREGRLHKAIIGQRLRDIMK